jgi:tetratricopeptide (TPR) repeat protein
VYEDAAKQYKKVKLPSRAAESYWKMAINQDRLGQNIKAAEHFGNAFAEYKETAQMIPHFADFCLDYAAYMNAWSEIERAKSTHDQESYADASKHYERVATVLEPIKRWGHLSSNFRAWSLLEKAEDLSRKESYTESIEAFNKSAELFKQAKEAFEQEIGKIENPDEREKAIELCKASLERKDYCVARINVEEARVADRNGDHAESATKYDSAATVLEGILEKEPDEREIRQIAFMCRAWQKMKMADSRISPELYCEASELFLKAKEQSMKDRTALLASGNGAFCKALEHGTTFEATRERSDFLRAKQYLENAANCYLKAGFDSASSWTSGTEMLFDASNYMTEAETEVDPTEKSKAYSLAEKCLERSANLFEKAGYVGRRDEVLRTLTYLREKREFALSLGELLTAPTEASSTRIMSPPGMTVEEPIGLVKFQRAFVQANLVAHPKELVVGEPLDLEIQLANLGKETAFLIDIEQLIPEGFDLVEKPEKCVVNDSGLNLKKRTLAPLETAEIKLMLKPKRKGKFTLAPRIKYMDETGEHKFCELEQAPVTVKELGIRGWLKGQL